MLKKLTLLSLVIISSSSSIQAGPIVAAIGYWASKCVMYGAVAVGVVTTAPVSSPVLASGAVGATGAVIGGASVGTGALATGVAAVESVSTGIGAFLMSLPTI